MRIAMLLHKSVEHDSRVRREAAALARAGHRVTVLELADSPGRSLEGFTRESVMPAAWMRRLPFHLYRVAFLAGFVVGILRVKPDVVHAHDAAMLLPGAIGARLTGAQLVYDSHELATSVPYRERSWAWFVGAIERLVVPRCAAIITVSDGIAARLRERYRLSHTPTVVRNVTALRVQGRGRLRERLGIGRDVPLVLHQGAPAPARGCELLVAAVAELADVWLAFLGDPEPGYETTLRAAIARSGARDRVRLLPSVPLGELLAHTAEADAGVTLLQDTCENHRLALPNKLFEYISAGIPVVASDLPETRGLIECYGVGWCAAPGDLGSLTRALSAALGSREDRRLHQRLAEAARELSWAREQRRLLGLYSQLARRSRTSDDQAVAAQSGDSGKGAVGATGAPGQRRSERDRAHRQLAPQGAAQLGEPDETGVAVGGRYAGLPDRDGAAARQDAPGLTEGGADILARAHSRYDGEKHHQRAPGGRWREHPYVAFDYARAGDAQAGGEHPLGEQVDPEQPLRGYAVAAHARQPPARATARVEQHSLALEHLWHQLQESAHRLLAHADIAGVLSAPGQALAGVASIAGVHPLHPLELSSVLAPLGRGAVSLHRHSIRSLD
ncbi:MAG TPA: glycosyltransferase [Solirubrobacteraceae bacterium]|jgi:glycosyltransferase involved in cell wall biosynthesis|nr:glycosyltransferase [Solirubrobacteraceae bacterium]